MTVTVGEFARGDTSIQITGLKPGNYYGIRLIATDDANLKSIGPLVRLRTLPSAQSSDDGAVGLEDVPGKCEPAAVHATSAPFENALPSPSTREASGPQHQARRVVSGRRNSPAASGGEQGNVQAGQSESSDEDESPEAIRRLTQRLEYLKAEKEKVDKEIQEEEQESKRHLAELTKERDRLRAEYKEKEEASSELRKHGNHLDRLNRTAQSKKAAKEKQLQQRKADRQKIKDDNVRWDKQTYQMRQDTQEMVKEKADVIAAKDKEVEEIRKTLAEDLAVIKSLEEEIRVKGIQIKEMEKEQEKLDSQGTGGQERVRIERENDQVWENKFQAMQAEVNFLLQNIQTADLEKVQAEDRLNWWMKRRAQNPEHFAPIPSFDFLPPVQRNVSRRTRQTNSRTSTISSAPAGYQSGSSAFNNASLISPPGSTTSPFFNAMNGTILPSFTDRTDISQSQLGTLTGGAPMSPAADNLLPSNLFRDDEAATNQQSPHASSHDHLSNANSDLFLGHAVSNSDASAYGPHTPVSAGSRAGSVLSSPHDSLQNLQSCQLRPDPFNETEVHPANSTSAPFHPSIAADSNPLATSRFGNLFSFRQRGKPGTQEAPPLGTLKQGQSHSFPRNVDQDGLDSDASRRRRGSYGNWANPMAGLLNRNTRAPEDSGLITARTASGRRSRLNMFGTKFDGQESIPFADQPSSSRPSSTYSYDQVLARPSSDSQRFGWSTHEGMPNRSSPLGANWSGGPWSRAPSRRPSMQHGSTSNLSLGSTPLGPEEHPGSFSKQPSEQAPIGTRPQSSQRPATPKLNPAAPAFKTLFSRKDAGKASKTSNRFVEKSRDKDSERDEPDETGSMHDTSPQDPRLSRDAQSITTAASTTDSHDSFDRSTSGTPTDVTAPLGTKETLMQKITRKSSSSKFNLNAWAKERGLKSKPGQPSTPTELEEDPSSEALLGKSAESASSTPLQDRAGRTSLSWTNIRRKSKKGDQALAEAIEKKSELGDDDDA